MPPSVPEHVIEQKLVECGLDSIGISVTYQNYLQGVEIVIKPEAKATNDQFACIHKAAGFEIVTFTDPAMAQQFSEFQFELFRPQMLEDSRHSLEKLGLLENFPDRTLFVSDIAFGEALESHCGLEKGGALKLLGETIIFEPPGTDPGYFGSFDNKYHCLLTAVNYAVAKGELKKFGFVGNEAVGWNVEK
jgi:hypothetical protein